MSRSLLLAFMTFSLVLLSSGCGGGGSSSSSTTGSLDFKTSATYDLSQYIVPTQNQVSTFLERTYTDDSGNKTYDSIPTQESDTTQEYRVGNNSVETYENGNLDTTYTITQTAITQTATDYVAEIVRYADMNDPIANTVIDIPLETLSGDSQMPLSCRLAGHVDSKTVHTKTFDDVIMISCKGFSRSDITYENIPMSVDVTLTLTSYYAKNLGEIGSIEETCYTINSTQTSVRQCTKTVSEIASIL